MTTGANRWTKEQFEAITESNCNMLVAAAAGAGKTSVLVERIIHKILCETNPIDIDRLLIVTFTNAAATEMRERIGDAIEKELEKTPLNKRLLRQLTLLNKANITTIHSFCLNVITNNYQLIDIDPNFRIASETESSLLKLEALEELFDEKYDLNIECEEFIDLIESYSGDKDDKKVQEMVLNLYNFIQSHPWPHVWLNEKVEMFNVESDHDFGKTLWAKVLMKYVSLELLGLCDIMKNAINLAKNSQELEAYLIILYEDLNNIELLYLKCNGVSEQKITWDECFGSFSNISFSKLPSLKKIADLQTQENIKEIRNEVKHKIKKICSNLFNRASVQINADFLDLYPIIKYLSSLVIELESKFSSKKRLHRLLDFNDLEHFCLQILTTHDESQNIIPSDIARNYREFFLEVLVDEYQDSNLLQEVILTMVSKSQESLPNLFMVGDVKQSIYRFRQAKPELFLKKYNTYLNIPGSKFRKIRLFKNFRSREEILNAVNFIFIKIMSQNIGELDYNDDEKLNYGSSYIDPDGSQNVGGSVEINIIDIFDDGINSNKDNLLDNDILETTNSDTDKEPENNVYADSQDELPDNIQSEANVIVKRIQDLMSKDKDSKYFHVYDKNLKCYRKLEYRDIVILLRATKTYAQVFIDQFTGFGIPVYADSETGYFKTIEVQIIISLLQIIDNPLQDIPLIAVLRSPIANFSSEDLIDIRCVNRNISMYETMKRVPELENNILSNKIQEFLDKLNKWRDISSYSSVDELIWFLYSDTGFYSYAGSMPRGLQRQANLRILFERAQQFEETSFKGLFNFINFINKLKSNKGDMGTAKILSENENVVRIMSIHKSKGLEFPIVFLAGCGRKFNLQDINKSILLHQDLGFGPDFVDFEKRVYYSTLPKEALKYKIRAENISEEMRILYVALTRAKEKLILTGCVRNMQKIFNKWSISDQALDDSKLPEFKVYKATNFYDWIGPLLSEHSWVVKTWSKKDTEILNKQTKSSSEQDFREIVYEIIKKHDLDLEKENLDIESRTMNEVAVLTENKPHEVERRLNWVYPYKMLSSIPSKVSVTEIKRSFDPDYAEELFDNQMLISSQMRVPAFLDDVREVSAAKKGTIMHHAMQHLDLTRAMDKISIRTQVEEMITNEFLSPKHAEVVDINKIYRFLTSPLGKRMLASKKVYKEVPFNIDIACSEIYSDFVHNENLIDEKVLLQGVIDCYFEENDYFVLIDFKTDLFSSNDIDAIKAKYGTQIKYYKRAIEILTNKNVKESFIYMFYNNQTVLIEKT